MLLSAHTHPKHAIPRPRYGRKDESEATILATHTALARTLVATLAHTEGARAVLAWKVRQHASEMRFIERILPEFGFLVQMVDMGGLEDWTDLQRTHQGRIAVVTWG